MEILNKINILLAYPLVILVRIYQKTLSFDHGWFKGMYPYGYCKFHPTCSEYARIVLGLEGLIGIPKVLIRVAKCNPFNSGGIDLPENLSEKFINE